MRWRQLREATKSFYVGATFAAGGLFMPIDKDESAYMHRRSARTVAASLLRPKIYSGLARLLVHSVQPIHFLLRYLRVTGSYPADLALRTPTGRVELTVFTETDLDTVNEIFFWDDYGSRRGDRVIVDFGANIGISTLYFLSRDKQAKVYCYEPLPQNIERLRHNLRPFAGRYELVEAAVCQHDGTADFGWEATGKFGGVGVPSQQRIEVKAVDSNRVLADVIATHGEIDLLKIDTEGNEGALTAYLTPEIASRIRRIAMEFTFAENPLSRSHEMSHRWPVTTFVRRDLVHA